MLETPVGGRSSFPLVGGNGVSFYKSVNDVGVLCVPEVGGFFKLLCSESVVGLEPGPRRRRFSCPLHHHLYLGVLNMLNTSFYNLVCPPRAFSPIACFSTPLAGDVAEPA